VKKDIPGIRRTNNNPRKTKTPMEHAIKEKNVSGQKKKKEVCERINNKKTPRAHKMPISIQRDKTNKTFTSKTTF
jgi:hypothetical protein